MSITKIFADGRIQAANPQNQQDVVTKHHLDANEDSYVSVVSDGVKSDIEMLATVSPNPLKGDVGVVKHLISTGKYSLTAYHYSGTAWEAMDGNYNAENVFFDEDLITTSAIGNITLING